MTDLRTRSTVRPEQRGAKRLRAQYGDRLVCVCYRYDTQGKRRYKTVELIVEEGDWEPSVPKRARDRLVKIRLAVPEIALRTQVKQAGGSWHPQERVWELAYNRVVHLGLTSRIVGQGL